MTAPRTVEHAVHFHVRSRRRARLELRPRATAVVPATPVPPVPAVPRIARLMALALRCDALVCSGAVANDAALARLAHVTRARISQISNLVHLAPDIQEEILFLPGRPRGSGAILLAHLQPIAALPAWTEQRRRWHALRHRS
jgi:hypothetical protein